LPPTRSTRVLLFVGENVHFPSRSPAGCWAGAGIPARAGALINYHGELKAARPPSELPCESGTAQTPDAAARGEVWWHQECLASLWKEPGLGNAVTSVTA